MHVTARLVGALFGVLLTAGVSYWAFNGRTSSVAPKNPTPLADPFATTDGLRGYAPVRYRLALDCL